MAGDVILTTGSLVVNSIYKIKGYKNAVYLPQTITPNFSQIDYSGYFGRFLTTTAFSILADEKVNVVDTPFDLTNTSAFWYVKVDPTIVVDYTNLRNTLKNL